MINKWRKVALIAKIAIYVQNKDYVRIVRGGIEL